MQLELRRTQAAWPREIEQYEDETSVLTLPGLDNSGPGHWQTHWEALPHVKRVEFPNWTQPKLHEWVPELDRAIRESSKPLVLAAHSLGCLAAIWWGTLYWSGAFREKIAGALLVAPPDVDAVDTNIRIRDFRPLPRIALPFPSIVVASTNDPYASLASSKEMARSWGSDFIEMDGAGHINAQSRLGEWSEGLRLLAGMSGRNPNLLVAELGLRTVLA